MFSFPPMVHGKVIRIEDLQANMPTPQGNPALGIPPQAPPQPAQPQIDINHLFEMMQGTKQNDLQLALQLLEKSKVQNAPPANQIGDMVNQMMGMFTLFGQMKEMFGQNLGDAPAGGGEETMIPVIGDLIKGLLNRNQPQQAPMMMPARRGALAPPRAQPSPAPTPPQPQQGGKQVERNSLPPQQSGGDNLSSLAGKLADLSPTDASEVLLEALGNMPEERRSAAMQHFFANMTGEDLLDDSSFDEDNYDDDEATQDNQTPNPGKQVQSNGGDGSRNR
jgi:hypothetical protein